ncbi:autotransporter strand-loop-strand O-heptosyltransferase, partial [Schwartzia sp. (in: firmicutes)]
ANPAYEPIILAYFPELQIVNSIQEKAYAQYVMVTFLTQPFLLPDSSRVLPAKYIGRFLLGQHRDPVKVLFRPMKPRAIAELYVCIAVQASGVAKSWLNPGGWDIVIDYLKKLGYRVLCLDRDKYNEDANGRSVSMPEGAENYTGNRPLTERVELLAYADFFIGLGSGLSWLADAAGCPVVLIGGHSLPMSEFDTPYRIINPLVCHGCYNDMNVKWGNPVCPLHNGTDREYECTVKISPRMVISAIDRLRNDLEIKKAGSL